MVMLIHGMDWKARLSAGELVPRLYGGVILRRGDRSSCCMPIGSGRLKYSYIRRTGTNSFIALFPHYKNVCAAWEWGDIPFPRLGLAGVGSM